MKRRKGGSIMVAVQAVDSSSVGLLRKAAAIAKARRCQIDLVHIVALPHTRSIEGEVNIREVARQIVGDASRDLQKLAARRELRGVRTRALVIWDYPAADALIREVLRRRPQLLLAESRRHGRFARMLLTNTDWELMRNCPCPLWLSKSRAGAKGPVMAALDPLHEHAKPAQLDDVILRQALDAVQRRTTRVLACHAYALPVMPVVDAASEPYWISMSGEQARRYVAALSRELQRLTDRHAIPAANRLVIKGDPVSVLPRVARKHRASLVVMGAVSRRALVRFFIGHTAERVIDALDCDVMIVKPRGFKTVVARRRYSR